MKNIEVVAAIIVKDGKILAVQKGKAKFDYVSYKWEFPGGKVESGESLEQAIIREILEELKIIIVPQQLLVTVEHAYPDFYLTMHCFVCDYGSGEIVLTEHVALKFLDTNTLNNLDWAAADLPVVEALMKDNVKI
jgi:8-oxo-dGTP diphosphatase